jgi:hypothetical protein
MYPFDRIYSPLFTDTTSIEYKNNDKCVSLICLGGQDTSGGVRITPQTGDLNGQYIDVTPQSPFIGLMLAPFTVKMIPGYYGGQPSIYLLDLWIFKCLPPLIPKRAPLFYQGVVTTSAAVILPTANRKLIQLWFNNESGGNCTLTVIAAGNVDSGQSSIKTVFSGTVATTASQVVELVPALGTSTPNVSRADFIELTAGTNNISYLVRAWDD